VYSHVIYTVFADTLFATVHKLIDTVFPAAVGSTWPLTKASTMNLSGSKVLSRRRADSLDVIYEPIV
jgi:hypothetical protein